MHMHVRFCFNCENVYHGTITYFVLVGDIDLTWSEASIKYVEQTLRSMDPSMRADDRQPRILQCGLYVLFFFFFSLL